MLNKTTYSTKALALFCMGGSDTIDIFCLRCLWALVLSHAGEMVNSPR